MSDLRSISSRDSVSLSSGDKSGLIFIPVVEDKEERFDKICWTVLTLSSETNSGLGRGLDFKYLPRR